MAYIYIDNFETVLTATMNDLSSTLPVSPDDVARIDAAFAYGLNVPRALAGPRFVRLPLVISGGAGAAPREIVYATHVFGGVVQIERTTGLVLPAGSTVRCAPIAELTAAGHMMYRLGSGDAVNAAPGERALLTVSTPVVWLRVPNGNNAPNFTGEDWPAEVVLLNAAGCTVRLEGYYGAVDFSVSGEPTTQSSITLPATCRIAVITLRRLPWPLRLDGDFGWMLTVERFA